MSAELEAVIAAVADQEAKGHTAESDGELPIAHFRCQLVGRAQDLDVALPGGNQNLDVAYRRAAKLAALAIATMRRIRHEQQKGAPIR